MSETHLGNFISPIELKFQVENCAVQMEKFRLLTVIKSNL